MNRTLRQLVFPCLLASLSLVTPSSMAHAAGADENWRTGFELSDVDGVVLCLTVWDDLLIAGGDFLTAGGRPSPHVAAWDGHVWTSLDGGCDATVRGLVVFQGTLIAAGDFSMAGAEPALHIARWDGAGWAPLGAGLNDTVRAVAIINGDLIAGGDFTLSGGEALSHIARWDGEAWKAIGAGFDGSVRAIGSYGGELIAGGDFTFSGSGAAAGIARWDGEVWQALGEGVEGSVHVMAEFAGELIAGGMFSNAGGLPASCLAAWNGETWREFGGGVHHDSQASVEALLVIDEHYLYVGGMFDRVGEWGVEMLALWIDSIYVPPWSYFHIEIDQTVRALAVYDGYVAVGGNFLGVAGIATTYLAALRPRSESPCSGSGLILTDPLKSLCIHEGRLLAAGRFFDSSGAGLAAAWNGIHWDPWLDERQDDMNSLEIVSAGGMLYLGGNHLHVLYPDYYYWYFWYLARWTGSEWVICGDEYWQGSPAFKLLTAWNGTPVSILDSGGLYARVVQYRSDVEFTIGTVNHSEGCVLTMGSFAGDLILGGSFSLVSQTEAHKLARYDGDEWTALCPPALAPNGAVTAVLEWDGGLAVGGEFESAGGTNLGRIGLWTGSAWQPMGSLPAAPTVLAEYQGDLVAGCDTPPLYLARWNGSDWEPMGSGPNGPVDAITPLGQKLYVGGEFTRAGGKAAYNFALWEEDDTATALLYFHLAREADRVIARWAMSEDSSGLEMSLRAVQAGNERTIACQEVAPAVYRAEDDAPQLAEGGRVDYSLLVRYADDPWQILRTVSLDLHEAAIPGARLHAAYPNPFNPRASVSFSLGDERPIRLAVYDSQGRRLRTLAEGRHAAGLHVYEWDGCDEAGRPLASGIYVLSLEEPGQRQSSKLCLLR